MPITEAQVWAALPARGFVRDYVTYASNCTDAHAAFHIPGALALLAAVAPRDMHVAFGAPIRANAFFLIVGPSGDRKTRAVTLARNLLMQASKETVAEMPGSTEGLVESVRDNPQQVIFYEEFGEFLAKSERGYLLPIKTALNSAYDCSPMGRALAKKRKGAIEDPRISLFAASAPGYLERHTEPVDWTEGFMARFITLRANRERDWEFPPGAPEGLAEQLVGQLQARNALLSAGKFLGFSQQARKIWSDWYHETSTFRSAREVSAAITRAPIASLKIAMLLAFDYGAASVGEDWQITEAELSPAIEIARLHVASVLEIGETLASSHDMRDRRTILGLLHPKDGRSLGFLCKEGKLLKKRAADIIETLLTEGVVFKVRIAGGVEGFIRRPDNELDMAGKDFATMTPPEGVLAVTSDAELFMEQTAPVSSTEVLFTGMNTTPDTATDTTVDTATDKATEPEVLDDSALF